MLDIRSIGAGGGSIARIDAGGMLVVGPQSAGANPGPACYGLGGKLPTVTDANVVTGRISPANFLGGKMSLDADAARTAIQPIADHLGLPLEKAALSIIHIANNNMVGALHSVLTEQGLDPRDFVLVAFGGAGPPHVSDLMTDASIPRGLVPNFPGQFSALGFIMADARVDRHRTVQLNSRFFDRERAAATMSALVKECIADLAAQGHTDVVIARSVEMRYLGQNHELEIPADVETFSDAEVTRLLAAFHDLHEARFGFRLADHIEIVNFLVTGIAQDRPARISGNRQRQGTCSSGVAASGLVCRRVGRYAGLCASRSAGGSRTVRTGFGRGERLRHGVGPGEKADRRSLRQPVDRELSGRKKGTPMDMVSLNIVGGILASICRDMGVTLMRTSYSTIFSESLDFTCALALPNGEMIATGDFCPAMIGGMPLLIRSCVNEIAVEDLEEGDVILHNDPYRGGLHTPEHTFFKPVFVDGDLIGFSVAIGHVCECRTGSDCICRISPRSSPRCSTGPT